MIRHLSLHALYTAVDVLVYIGSAVALVWVTWRVARSPAMLDLRSRQIIGQLHVDVAAERVLRKAAEDRAARAESELIAAVRIRG